ALGVEGIHLDETGAQVVTTSKPIARVETVEAATAQQPSRKLPSISVDKLFGEFASSDDKLPSSTETFDDIQNDIGDCTRCSLHLGRTNVCHTEGNRKARLMFVGEAPGADEDAQARPFVGRAGQLLTK